MNTQEVAETLISLCNDRKFVEAVQTLYADDVVSLEAAELGNLPREVRGKEAVLGKNVWWFENNEVNDLSITGPFISPERFAVIYTFHRTKKDSGERDQFTELAIYTVVDGKITHEEFLNALPA